MIVLDSCGLIAALDTSDKHHKGVRDILENTDEPLLLSPLVFAEVNYMVLTKLGQQAETTFLEDIADGSYKLVPFTSEDVRQGLALLQRYSALNLGLADASVAVIAAKNRTTRVLSMDERCFRTVTPLWGQSFTMLPADY